MITSSNSDELRFTCLTNKSIKEYFDTIPRNVEEITIWNYQMCLYPNLITLKEALIIPPFDRFTNLKCVRFYNERIVSMEGPFPPSVQRVFFISCLLKEKWMNVCLYGSRVNNMHPVISATISKMSTLHLLEKTSKKTPISQSPSPPANRRQRSSTIIRRRTQRSKSLWRIFASMFNTSWVFSTPHCKILPQKEVEMIEIIPYDNPIDTESAKDLIKHCHNIESITRFKKTYDLLVNESIIAYLTDGL